MDYAEMVRQALRQVVREALRVAADEGLPGEHHFFVSFATGHPGVAMDRVLRDVHPEQMTVVLQHRFWDLVVDEEAFEVTLAFDGARRRLRVPFAAIRSFADPVAEFGLSFEAAGDVPEEAAGEGEGRAASGPGDSKGSPEKSEKVVSLDDFRKR